MLTDLLPQLPPANAVASGFFLRDAATPRWLLLRATKHGEWGFPKGHVDAGEDLIATAMRECAEEAGIGLVEITGPPQWDSYTLPGGRTKISVYYPAQTATSEVTLSHEHDRFRWCEALEVASLISHPTLLTLFRRSLKAASNR
jgi:8-oxo-dGTP pyrophosphatase MutT (NUDIX family)